MAKKRSLRHYRLILVCLLLSALSWFAVRMSKNYTQTYRFAVEFVNLPKGKAVSHPSDSTLVVEVNGKGMFLLSLEFKRKIIPIDYPTVTTPSQRNASYAVIQAKRLKDYLVEEMDFPKNTVIVEPKKIVVEVRNEK